MLQLARDLALPCRETMDAPIPIMQDIEMEERRRLCGKKRDSCGPVFFSEALT